jgi:hypothetical protein
MNGFMIGNEGVSVKLTKGRNETYVQSTFEYQRRICVWHQDGTCFDSSG